MRVNVTAGDCLNEILSSKCPSEVFVPFREAMIKGQYEAAPFSEAFLIERAKTHKSSVEDYRKHMEAFLHLLSHLNDYDEIVLWFGDEPFCLANIDVVLKTLQNRGYANKIVLNTVVEENGEILHSKVIQ